MDDPETKSPFSLREKDRTKGAMILTTRARALRRQGNRVEDILWKHLRGRRLMGYKFRRQVVVEPYIVDFMCVEAKLIIEADGGQHSNQVTYDDRRTTSLEKNGYQVIRFWNHEILEHLEIVLEQIRSALIDAPSPQPSPGGRGRKP
jgi:very-short-patch-repair endonuclease